MKKLILILMILFSYSGKSQSIDQLLNSFKEKKLNNAIPQCALPFNLSAGSMIDKNEIRDINELRQKLQKLFKERYFDNFFKGTRINNYSKTNVSFEVRSFNESGELESESTLTFYFKKSKDGTFKLFKIVLAG